MIINKVASFTLLILSCSLVACTSGNRVKVFQGLEPQTNSIGGIGVISNRRLTERSDRNENNSKIYSIKISQVTREFLKTIEDPIHPYYLYLVFNERPNSGEAQRRSLAEIFMCQFEDGTELSIDKRFLVPIYAPLIDSKEEQPQKIKTPGDFLANYDYQKSKAITNYVKRLNKVDLLPPVYLLGSERPILGNDNKSKNSLPLIDLSSLSLRQMEVLINDLVNKLEATHIVKHWTSQDWSLIEVQSKFNLSIKHSIATKVVRFLDKFEPFQEAILSNAQATNFPDRCL